MLFFIYTNLQILQFVKGGFTQLAAFQRGSSSARFAVRFFDHAVARLCGCNIVAQIKPAISARGRGSVRLGATALHECAGKRGGSNARDNCGDRVRICSTQLRSGQRARFCAFPHFLFCF